MASKNPFWIRVRVGDGLDARIVAIEGRAAWALDRLIEAGERGCTPIDDPAPRWSHYVWLLRHEHQIVIETIHEPHGGAFAGTHARYILHSPVTVLAMRDPRRSQTWVAA